MREYAAQKGGKCLSKKYINNKTKLKWQCGKGHQWFAKYTGKYWCPYCAGTARIDIHELQEIAAKRGGKLLSDENKNQRTHLLWECNKGHQWYAQANAVVNSKQWCPQCAGHIKKDIKEMQELAAARGGKLLSDVYINSHSYMLNR